MPKSFKGQTDRFWKELKVGVEHVINGAPPQPTVFLITHQNERQANAFANLLATKIGNGCLDAQTEPLILYGTNLNTDEMISDYGRVIAEFKSRLEDARVMVVHDVHKINSKVVEAFHTICDKETPLVRKSIIVFTFPVPAGTSTNTNELYDFVEEQLTKLWKSSVSRNKIQPLLARMTENILFLKA